MNEPSVFNGPEVTMHKDALHLGGAVEHRDVHNAYGLYLHMATAEGLKRRDLETRRPFVLSRAFFAGSQRYGAIWTGDNAAQWDHLTVAGPMLLSMSLAGISFVGSDIGGFFGNVEPELLSRWYQAAVFHPFYREHAHLDSKRREPFLFSEPHKSIMKEAIRTRYSFLPYLYTLFYQGTKTGVPPMRPLWVEFPGEENLFAEENQYLLGKYLMVKPITSAGQREAEVLLPGSSQNTKWYNFAGESFSPQVLTVSTPLEYIPIFVRGGGIIPKKERARRSSSQMKGDPYTLLIALDNNGRAEGQVYLDDEETYKYLSGDYLLTTFSFSTSRLTSSSEGKLTPVNTVEKIVIMGLPNISRVSLLIDGDQRNIEFWYKSNLLVLRKPDLPLHKSWEIYFS